MLSCEDLTLFVALHPPYLFLLPLFLRVVFNTLLDNRVTK